MEPNKLVCARARSPPAVSRLVGTVPSGRRPLAGRRRAIALFIFLIFFFLRQVRFTSPIHNDK
jgi:hypothetical protein